MKPIRIAQWDDANIAHFVEHGRCSRLQVEDVLFSRCHPTRRRFAREVDDEARYRFEGETCASRLLVVVAVLVREGVFRPITCWPLVGKHRASYLGWRRTLVRR